MIEYLDELETKFENNLAGLSGAQMGSNHEKNWRSKILTPLCHAHRGVKLFELCNRNLGKIKTEFKNTLACLSGAQIGLNHKK